MSAAAWEPVDWRARWAVPVTPSDHTMRVIPPVAAHTGIAVEIDMPGRSGISGWCFLSPEEAHETARLLIKYADEILSRASDYRTPDERERNAFELGRDYEKGQTDKDTQSLGVWSV